MCAYEELRRLNFRFERAEEVAQTSEVNHVDKKVLLPLSALSENKCFPTGAIQPIGQKRSVGAEIGRGSLGTKLGWPGATVYACTMGKLAFGMLSPT